MRNTEPRHHLYATRIDIPERTRSEVILLLNSTLAATTDLWSQVKYAHWNVKGPHFYQLHLLFDEIAGDLYNFIDLVAERVTTLGGIAHGTIREAAKASILPEYPLDTVDGEDHVIAIAEKLAAYAKHVREAIDSTDNLDDKDTSDIYTEISRKIDMRLWFIEAHLQGSNNGAHSAEKLVTAGKARK